tara:strand:+ start:312 stop:572 length:261 start_codon:yes stop_codon:yes gene_type:complete
MTDNDKLNKVLPSLTIDLLKKFTQLKKLRIDDRVLIISGIADGLMNNVIPYPSGSLIPPIRFSMEPDYCAGFDVGKTWAKIADLSE